MYSFDILLDLDYLRRRGDFLTLLGMDEWMASMKLPKRIPIGTGCDYMLGRCSQRYFCFCFFSLSTDDAHGSFSIYGRGRNELGRKDHRPTTYLYMALGLLRHTTLHTNKHFDLRYPYTHPSPFSITICFHHRNCGGSAGLLHMNQGAAYTHVYLRAYIYTTCIAFGSTH